MARLEKRLGIRVFERTTRSVRLTDEGREFYEQVMPLIAELSEATSNAARAMRAKSEGGCASMSIRCLRGWCSARVWGLSSTATPSWILSCTAGKT
ncbi:LysR family transcriptional regulator [Ewingella americana]